MSRHAENKAPSSANDDDSDGEWTTVTHKGKNKNRDRVEAPVALLINGVSTFGNMPAETYHPQGTGAVACRYFAAGSVLISLHLLFIVAGIFSSVCMLSHSLTAKFTGFAC